MRDNMKQVKGTERARRHRATALRWTVGAAMHYADLSAWYRENLKEVR